MATDWQINPAAKSEGPAGVPQFRAWTWPEARTAHLMLISLHYVVVHELAHLHQPHYTPEFWQRVEHALPDFARRKFWLAEHGMGLEGI